MLVVLTSGNECGPMSGGGLELVIFLSPKVPLSLLVEGESLEGYED